VDLFITWLERLAFDDVIWLLPAAITIHMVEEMIWLPKWSQTAGSWHKPVSSRQFAFASIILIMVAFALTAAAARSGKGGTAVYLTLGLALTMLLNIYFPHVGSAIALKRPGIVTGLLINLPLMPLFVWLAWSDGYVDGLWLLLSAAPMVITAALGWSLLLYTGSILLK
jgi:hypothetical protein